MSSRSTQIIGGPNRQHAFVDEFGALHTTTAIEVSIGLGQVFTATTIRSVLLQNTFFDVLIRVGTTPISWLPIFAVAIETEGSLFENPTVTATGTIVPTDNRNRTSAKTTTTVCYEDPTLTDDGDLIGTILIPQDTIRVTPVPFIFKAGTDYIVRLKNVGIADVQVSMQNLMVDRGAA